LALFTFSLAVSAEEVNQVIEEEFVVNNEYPVVTSISPSRQEIRGTTATAAWTISWGGGNGTQYNVKFNYGDGNYWSDPRANYTSRYISRSYSLGSMTSATYRPSLVVYSGLGYNESYATVLHYK
jgi:hypothetical protein